MCPPGGEISDFLRRVPRRPCFAVIEETWFAISTVKKVPNAAAAWHCLPAAILRICQPEKETFFASPNVGLARDSECGGRGPRRARL